MEEKKNGSLDFIEQIFSPPCIILAELAAIYISYISYGKPEGFLPWLIFAGKALLLTVGVLILVFLIMILAMIVVGGIASNINLDYIGYAMEIIVFIAAVLIIPTYL